MKHIEFGNNFHPLTLYRDKFTEANAKKHELQNIAEEWLEEKRKKTALKEKMKRMKGYTVQKYYFSTEFIKLLDAQVSL